MRQSRKHTKPIIGGIGLIILIALSVLIMTAPTGAVMNEQPATAVSQPSYIPNPVMNTNVTWSSFNSSWGELEYYNGTSYQNLTAQPNPAAPNPISINTADIIAKRTLQNDNISGKTWNTVKVTTANTPPAGAVTTAGNSTIAGVTEPYIEGNGSANGAYSFYMNGIPIIPVSNLPSNNLAYDYITYGATLSGANTTGVYAVLTIYNGTANTFNGFKIYPGQSVYASISLAEMQKENGGKGFNTTGSQAATEYNLQPYLAFPQATTTQEKLTVFALAVTEYPITLGENATGETPTQITGEAHLQTYKPSTQEEIVNNGYTVAVSQSLQNTTESQSSISSGSYIEQATYQGTFSLPSAPDLSYGNTIIQMNLTTPGSQYEVANLNGISYLATLKTQDNGTFVFATVNPNQQNSLILEIEFTASQWNASTVAPSFFSIQGIEYYWWVGVIGLLSIVGLGAAASSHFSGDEENLKVPKGKFGR